jgi:basic membrane lipoprotein Med (substrate-binding protein (PBP1-ABC) superfamily)
MLKRYDRAEYTILEQYASGEFRPGAQIFDLATGAVDLSYSGGFIDDIRPQLDDLRQRVISGEIDVPTIPPKSRARRPTRPHPSRPAGLLRRASRGVAGATSVTPTR